MRFPTQASLEDLRALVEVRDDLGGPHLIWIHQGGEVEVHTVQPPRRVNEVRAEIVSMGTAAYVFETLAPGGGYVGPEAAADASWMAELHAHLKEGWSLYKQACPEP